MRVRILSLLRARPYNTNQVSTMLKIDYKTAEHHLRVLRENRLVAPSGEGYGAVFLLTAEMEAALPVLDEIVSQMRRADAGPQGARDA